MKFIWVPILCDLIQKTPIKFDQILIKFDIV